MLNSSVCFFPDTVTRGDSFPTGFKYVPCNPSAPNSACCVLGDSCVGNGLCYRNIAEKGSLYRGACTDRHWQDTACSIFCTSSSPGAQSGAQDNCEFIQYCPSGQWTCSGHNNCSNPSLTFSLLPGAVQQVNITGTIAAYASFPSSSSCTEAPTASATRTSSCGDRSCNTVALGVGVGIPLGALLLTALAWGYWQTRQLSALRSAASRAAVPTDQEPAFDGTPSMPSIYEVAGRRAPRELP